MNRPGLVPADVRGQRRFVGSSGRGAGRVGRRLGPVLAVLVVVMAVAVAAHLLVGGGRLSPDRLWATAFGGGDAVDAVILWDLRLPRAAAAAGSGTLLAVAGWLLQDGLDNPLAAPEVTGVGPGAAVGVVVGVTAGWVSTTAVPATVAAATVGGLLGGAAVWVVAGRRRHDPWVLAASGVAVSAVALAVVSVGLALDPERLGGVARWLVGSADGRVGTHAALACGVAMLGTGCCVLGSGALRVLAAGSDAVRGLGLPVELVRAGAIGAAVLMTAAAVAVVGAVAFVGLGVPHLARRLVGADPRRGLPVTAALGAVVLTGADVVAQAGSLVLATAGGLERTGVPLGSVTALVGSVAVLLRARRLAAGA
ncbi:MAG: iron chelate uptake ABC transporter family permease subunit [Angustibacter sp.]